MAKMTGESWTFVQQFHTDDASIADLKCIKCEKLEKQIQHEY